MNIDTQSTLNWSQCLLGCPDTKCLPHTRSFSNFSAVRFALLMAEIHCLRRVDVSPSTCSPWLVITRGTRNNLTFSRCVCALPVLVPHPTMRHSTIITRHWNCVSFRIWWSERNKTQQNNAVHGPQDGRQSLLLWIGVTWVNTPYRLPLGKMSMSI